MNPQATPPALRILSLEDSDIDVEIIVRELKRGGVEFVSRRVQTGSDYLREIAEFQPELILAAHEALVKMKIPEESAQRIDRFRKKWIDRKN